MILAIAVLGTIFAAAVLAAGALIALTGSVSATGRRYREICRQSGDPIPWWMPVWFYNRFR